MGICASTNGAFAPSSGGSSKSRPKDDRLPQTAIPTRLQQKQQAEQAAHQAYPSGKTLLTHGARPPHIIVLGDEGGREPRSTSSKSVEASSVPVVSQEEESVDKTPPVDMSVGVNADLPVTPKLEADPEPAGPEVQHKESETDVQLDQQETPEPPVLAARESAGYSYVMAGGENAKEGNGSCMLCLELLPNDPRLVVNLCNSSPRCLCLLHRSCYLNPDYEMNDMLRRCMLCKQPADPDLVRQAVKARHRPLGR